MLPETKKARQNNSLKALEATETLRTVRDGPKGRSKPVMPRDPSDAFANSKAMTEPNRKQVEKLSRVQQIYEDGAQKPDFRVTEEEGPC